MAPILAKSFPSRFRATEIPLLFDAGDILPTASKAIVSDTLWRKNGRPSAFRARLKGLFGQEVIWLKGVPDHHIGMYAAPLDEKIVLVGDPDAGRRLWSASAQRKLGKADFSPRATIPFRNAASQLRAAGFRVIAMPLVMLGPKTYVTYTNGVFEKRGSRRIVYMPTYGDRKLDSAAQRVYQSAGWEVRPIPVQSVFRFRGTIGCLVNVLQRR